MKNVALQMYSIRELMAKDVRQTLLDTAKAGYAGVEFAGYFDHTADEIKSYLDEAGLVCAGTHTGWNLLQPDTIDETMRFNEKIGNRLIILPGVDGAMYGDRDSSCRMGATLNDIGAKLRANGFAFYYHNHHREFAVYDGKYALDYVYENSDPENLKVELDCYWAYIGGVDPIAYMKKYGKRCSLLHMKDAKADSREKAEKNIFECTEVGSGVIDFPGIVAQGKENGVLWYTVEQESFDMPMLDSIALSAKWLNENV